MSALNAVGVSTGIHYPVALHLSPAYAGLGFKRGDFPVAEKACDEVLSLPMFPGLAAEAQRRVIDELQQATSPATAGVRR
jgi:dTDP-4-amino-4,6-dideoxygalactose transaminase